MTKLEQWRIKQLRAQIRCRVRWNAVEVEPDEHPSPVHTCRLSEGHVGYCKCKYPNCQAMHIDYRISQSTRPSVAIHGATHDS